MLKKPRKNQISLHRSLLYPPPQSQRKQTKPNLHTPKNPFWKHLSMRQVSLVLPWDAASTRPPKQSSTWPPSHARFALRRTRAGGSNEGPPWDPWTLFRFGSLFLVLVIGGRDYTMVCTANWMPSCCPTSFTRTKTYIHWSYPNKTWDLEVILTIPQNGMYDMRKFTRSFTLISSTTVTCIRSS